MPSNSQYADFLDELKASIDPIDVATLFAGLRNSVPLGMLFRSGETNAGHDEMLAKLRGPAVAPAPPTIDPAESNRRAQMDFEMRYPDPRIRELLISEMLKQSRDPYSPTTATRRRDFEEAPMRADQFMSAVPKKKKFANGGAIDFSIPDMQDGGRFIPDPQPYNRGGGVKKTLDQMQAEIAQKLKPQPQPDLSRRKFFGLGKAEQLMPFDSAMQLNKKDPAFQEALALYMHDNRNMFKNAPAITEKTVTIDPGKGAAKSTLKSLSETPVSRREVLKSAAGQVLQGALPKGLMPDVGDVAKQITDITTPIAPTKSSIPAMMAAAIKAGMNEEEAVAHVASQFTKPPRFGGLMAKGEDPAEYLTDHLERLHGNISEPYINYSPEATGAVRPSKAFQELIDRETEAMKPLQLKPIMRELKSVDEKMYSNLIKAAKDRSMASVEDLLSYPGVDPSVVDRWLKGELKSLPPSYRDKLDYDY